MQPRSSPFDSGCAITLPLIETLELVTSLLTILSLYLYNVHTTIVLLKQQPTAKIRKPYLGNGRARKTLPEIPFVKFKQAIVSIPYFLITILIESETLQPTKCNAITKWEK